MNLGLLVSFLFVTENRRFFLPPTIRFVPIAGTTLDERFFSSRPFRQSLYSQFLNALVHRRAALRANIDVIKTYDNRLRQTGSLEPIGKTQAGRKTADEPKER